MSQQGYESYEERVESYKPLAIRLIEEHGVDNLTPKILLDALGVDYEEGIADTCLAEDIGSSWMVFSSRNGIGVMERWIDRVGEDHTSRVFFDLKDTRDVQVALSYLQRFNEPQEQGFFEVASGLVEDYGLDGINASKLLDILGISHEVGEFGDCRWSKPGVSYILTRYFDPNPYLELEVIGSGKKFDKVIELQSISDVEYALKLIAHHC